MINTAFPVLAVHQNLHICVCVQGLLGVSIPAEVGGVGASFLEEAIVAEEMSYANCSSPAMAVHSTICM